MDLFNSKFVRQEKRWPWIDYDKGISIILVGYGHCYETLKDHGLPLDKYPFFDYIGVFLYGFRMPLFFIISGLLVVKSLNKHGLGAYIANRNNNILYPLFVWGTIQVTLQIIMNRYTHNGYTSIDYLNLIINPRRTGIFWYLNALYCIGVIYAFLHSRLKMPVIGQLSVGIIMYVIYPHLYTIKAGLFIDIFEYYIFFALGDLLSKLMLDEKSMQVYTSWKFFLPLLIAFITIQYYCTPINMGDSPFGVRNVELNKPYLFFAEALIGCALSINCSFFLQKLKALTFLRVVGYHSLFIYCAQIIFMTVTRTVCMSVLHITSVPLLILIIWPAGIVLPIFLYNFCLRFGLWWLYSFKKPGRQIEGITTARLFSFNSKKKPAKV
ncbi:acyltransferase family protein [Mucilaginibacter sp. FT3.2]|uniref:acyltransferase family protein n=1 Tax=Mucilaginibacter sp. FT3.2 TaxID=2723090 RepID=UPI001613AE1B|nr:acyltransferase [Mucilaginibacter sp. FT3.2]MBB6234186.1 fucose 4-O-acetylase-like acetyltransferase [Mucilaginibacter sp. FT3.2]